MKNSQLDFPMFLLKHYLISSEEKLDIYKEAYKLKYGRYPDLKNNSFENNE